MKKKTASRRPKRAQAMKITSGRAAKAAMREAFSGAEDGLYGSAVRSGRNA